MSPVSLLPIFLAEQAQGLQWAGAGVLEVLTALYHQTTNRGSVLARSNAFLSNTLGPSLIEIGPYQNVIKT